MWCLIHTTPITNAVDNIVKYFYSFFRENKLDISYGFSARWMIHMKCQALFDMKNN